MTDQSPEFEIEIILDTSPEKSDREKTMERIVALVESEEFSLAQDLVDESGIKLSEAASHVARK